MNAVYPRKIWIVIKLVVQFGKTVIYWNRTELVRAVAALMAVNGDLTLTSRRMHATGENLEKSKQL